MARSRLYFTFFFFLVFGIVWKTTMELFWVFSLIRKPDILMGCTWTAGGGDLRPRPVLWMTVFDMVFLRINRSDFTIYTRNAMRTHNLFFLLSLFVYVQLLWSSPVIFCLGSSPPGRAGPGRRSREPIVTKRKGGAFEECAARPRWESGTRAARVLIPESIWMIKRDSDEAFRAENPSLAICFLPSETDWRDIWENLLLFRDIMTWMNRSNPIPLFIHQVVVWERFASFFRGGRRVHSDAAPHLSRPTDKHLSVVRSVRCENCKQFRPGCPVGRGEGLSTPHRG